MLRKEHLFKYQGLGNDFVLLDRRRSGADVDSATVVALCDRRLGVGADGVLVVLPSSRAQARMVVHNADGSTPEMCGNGLRCVAKYLADGLAERPATMDIETGAGVRRCTLHYREGAVEEVEIDMGPARLIAPSLPSAASGRPFIDQPLPGFPQLKGTAVSMGNPHLVLFDVPLERAAELGSVLEHCPGFPERTNVELVQPLSEGLEVVVWERGVGLTQACGTGACATVAAAAHKGLLPPQTWVPVRLPGGVLRIRVQPELSQVELRGPATYVFEAHLG